MKSKQGIAIYLHTCMASNDHDATNDRHQRTPKALLAYSEAISTTSKAFEDPTVYLSSLTRPSKLFEDPLMQQDPQVVVLNQLMKNPSSLNTSALPKPQLHFMIYILLISLSGRVCF